MELEKFISWHSDLPWSPGTVDCLTTVSDWLITRGFDDAVTRFRGTYHDEAGFRAIIEKFGGAVGVFDPCAESIGLVRIEKPRKGSVGVVGSSKNIHRQFGVIFNGERWLARGEFGFVPIVARPLAVWDDL